MHIKTGALVAALITLGMGLFSGCSSPSGGTPPSSDAALESLQIAGMREMIPPAFDPDTTDYTVLVDNATTTLVITAAARSSKASVSGAGDLGTLEEGDTSLELTVTAQNGAVKTYRLVIVRLDPLGFGPASDPPLLVPGPGEGQLTVQWNAVHGADAYELLYDTDGDITGAQTVSPEAGSLSYCIEGITRGLDYYVWVRAKNGDAVKDLPSANTHIPAAFASFEALAAFLGSAPQNSAAAPYFVTMSGLATVDLNRVIDGVDVSMGALFSALQGRYVTVDLRALTGPTIPSVSVQAAMDRDRLTGIILPDTLEDLGAEVFRNCANLVSVEFGGNLITIGNWAFDSSGLTGLELPDSLQTIGMYAFAETALETLELSPGLESIGDYAFSCPTLTQVDFRGGNPGAAGLSIARAFAGCTALKTARMPDSLDSLLGDSFSGCPALELLSIPATTKNVDVRAVSQSGKIRFETRGAGKFGTALEGRVLTQLGGTVWITAPGLNGGEIEVPEGVIEITESFFSGGFTGITLPSTLTVINNRLFDGSAALERVTINGAVTSIGDMAFYGCSSLISISLPESLRHIGFRAFMGSGLRSITVPPKVESYGPGPGGDDDNEIFVNCLSLEDADIRTPHLAGMMFIGCRELKEISLAPETAEIAARAFAGCVKLAKINPDESRDINLPPGLETIRPMAFHNTALGGELEIPPGVKTIESIPNVPEANPFYYCQGITKLILPRSLNVNINAFEGLDFVESFGLNGTGETLMVSPEGKLLIKEDAVILAARTLGDITIPAGVRDYTKITGKTSLTGLVFEEDPTRTSIPQNAFNGCANLVRVTLSSNVQTLYSSTFKGCANLVRITLPGNVEALHSSAFDDCAALEELIITNVTTLTYPMDRTVFRNCVALTSIKVPQALVDVYKAHSKWKSTRPGVVGAPYLSDLIVGAGD